MRHLLGIRLFRSLSQSFGTTIVESYNFDTINVDSVVPDTRKHRGPHPQDAELFGPDVWPALSEAVAHLSWLLSHAYAERSALKLVGDRFQLTERQRIAVMRSACSDQSLHCREQTQIAADRLAGRSVDLDGFNVLTTVEAALAGGVILCGRDGCYRDMASMHGSYRKVEETRPALVMIGEVLAELGAAECCWFLDRPVSNSGRLATIVRKIADERGWQWRARLENDVDPVLSQSSNVVASADSVILDRSNRWHNLAREVIDRRIPNVNLVALTGQGLL